MNFADDQNIVVNTRGDTEKVAIDLEKSANKVCLKINVGTIQLLNTEANIIDPNKWIYKKKLSVSIPYCLHKYEK